MKKQSPINFNLLDDHHLTDESHAGIAGLCVDEYDRIKRMLKRLPNKVELGVIGAMWSEHCSYKSSRVHLAKLPTTGKEVLVGPGENAGAIHIGDDLAIVFKIESHNHPSFIEPVQGAATGVGGILRDIFTMGARPFAAANLLRFGHKTNKKVPYLMNGVVEGISRYGNCFGVPTILSNIDFDESYNGNNLVNAFAIGVVHKDDIFLGKASGLLNRVLYVGAKTGRDGIMGAVMASEIFNDDTEHKRPTVQVGDPFTEKLLLEACLEVFREKLIVGIQDMGAAGLTCSTFEMANRASTGLLINLDHVPLRDATMTAYDIMLSESQERMLMVASPANVERIQEIFDKYALDCVDIGEVTGDGLVKINYKGRMMVDLSATLIIENAPRYRRNYLSEVPYSRMSLKETIKPSLQGAIDSFVLDLGQRSTNFITRQFDHHIGLNTIVGPEQADAALIKVPNTDKAVAISLMAHGKLCKVNPFLGAARTVFLSALEVSAQGASPVGITNCLNFGSPESIAVMTDLKHIIDGMAHAAISLKLPIISGNVSLYNETNNQPILPTLALCTVGLSTHPHKPTKFSNTKAGDSLILLGELPDDYAGCESIVDISINLALRPWDASFISTMCEILQQAIKDGLVNCASVIGRGGLLLAVIKLMANSQMGSTLDFDAEWLEEELPLGLLSEDSPRVLLSISEENLDILAKACANRLPLYRMGHMGGDDFVIRHLGRPQFLEAKDRLVGIFNRGLEEYLA